MLLFLLFLFLVQLMSVVKGNVVFEVHHKYGGRGKGKAGLGALREHDSRRHRRMLAAIDFPLGGDGSPTNAAYVTLDNYFDLYMSLCCLCSFKFLFLGLGI